MSGFSVMDESQIDALFNTDGTLNWLMLAGKGCAHWDSAAAYCTFSVHSTYIQKRERWNAVFLAVSSEWNQYASPRVYQYKCVQLASISYGRYVPLYFRRVEFKSNDPHLHPTYLADCFWSPHHPLMSITRDQFHNVMQQALVATNIWKMDVQSFHNEEECQQFFIPA